MPIRFRFTFPSASFLKLVVRHTLWVLVAATSPMLPSSCLAQIQADEEVSDPFEGFNRAIFSFNDTVDIFVLEPLARGYDFIVPDPVETSVSNFFRNLRSPIYMVGDLLQLRFRDFSVHTSRFLINSTVGVVGLFDVAKHFDLEHIEQDFGLTLARYGVGPGPYIVLPLLGPSTLRDTTGMVLDLGLDPLFYTFAIPDLHWEERLLLDGGLRTLELINTRSRLLGVVESAKGASLDYYLFVRSAYGQRRAALIKGEIPDTPSLSDDPDTSPSSKSAEGFADVDSSEDLYIFEDEDEDKDLYIFEDDE